MPKVGQEKSGNLPFEILWEPTGILIDFFAPIWIVQGSHRISKGKLPDFSWPTLGIFPDQI